MSQFGVSYTIDVGLISMRQVLGVGGRWHIAVRSLQQSAGSSAKKFIFGEQSTFKTTEDVLRAEYEAIWGDTLSQTGFEAAYRTDVQKKEQAALCLSGGGIRSAAFSLGVIQVLAYRGLLTQFQYLSTVSGGGYIGGWLSRWIAEDHQQNAAWD
jgi:Patatin-like phospholipase